MGRKPDIGAHAFERIQQAGAGGIQAHSLNGDLRTGRYQGCHDQKCGGGKITRQTDFERREATGLWGEQGRFKRIIPT